MRTNLDSRVLLLNFFFFVVRLLKYHFPIHSLVRLCRLHFFHLRFKYSRWQFCITIYAFIVCVYVFLLLNVLILLLSVVGFVCEPWQSARLHFVNANTQNLLFFLSLSPCVSLSPSLPYLSHSHLSNVHIEIYTQDAWYINLYRHSKYIKLTLSHTLFTVVARSVARKRVSECLVDDMYCFFLFFFKFLFLFCNVNMRTGI